MSILSLSSSIALTVVKRVTTPTFYQIYKKKSTEEFQSLPYVVALFSSMLWIYYALVKKDASLLLITINSFGCVIETIYLAIFLIYAPSKTRLWTIKLLLMLNVFGFGAMLLSTLYLTTGSKRLTVIGWICLVFNISVFAAPLCIIKRVIKTKSVEFMPFSLSFFLTINAVMWFFYGLLLKDYYVAMVLYLIYRNAKTPDLPMKLQELNSHTIDVGKLSRMEPSEPNHVTKNGNVISFMVFLAPLPTFYQIYKKKSTDGFQSLPYIVALFSSMLWIYYALVKKDASLLLITINSFGCVIETIYLAIFLIYAPSKTRLWTIKLLLMLNVFGFGAMLLSTLYLTTGSKRLSVIGWICLVLNISVFAAPLCIMKRVIKTKSVEFMPFSLSFFLTINAVMWFFYGLLLKDYYIALPNTLGFLFGIIQMVLYLIYRNAKPQGLEEQTKVQELNGHIIDVVKPNHVTKNGPVPVIETASNV
ncbi:Bidirectional sugar transporter SWEET14 [Glycine max]|nr:Bidirectional sugar transporter SWEET14 [Glycine max]